MELVARDTRMSILRYFTRNRTIRSRMFYISDEGMPISLRKPGKEFDDRSATEIPLESFSRTAKQKDTKNC